MLFGPMFYRRIRKLRNWQQQIFATALAQRMLPNYTAFMGDAGGEGTRLLGETLEQLWLYASGISDVPDWRPVRRSLHALLLPEEQGDQFGVRASNEAVKCVLAAVGSVLEHTGNESSEASELSVSTVIASQAASLGREMAEEEILENEAVQGELDFQMELVRRLSGHRSPEFIRSIRTLAANEGYSNIGIPAGEGD